MRSDAMIEIREQMLAEGWSQEDIDAIDLAQVIADAAAEFAGLSDAEIREFVAGEFGAAA